MKHTSVSRFTSRREKILWVWTLTVVIALYSTIGLAQTLAEAVRDSGLGAGLFILGYILVLATIVTQGLTQRPSGTEIGVALGIAAAYILMFVRMTIAAERTHLIEYGVVAVFIYEALTERARQGRQVMAPAVFAILLTSLIGVLDECIQFIVPSRVFDPRDILFNLIAAAMSVTASVALAWVRRRLGR